MDICSQKLSQSSSCQNCPPPPTPALERAPPSCPMLLIRPPRSSQSDPAHLGSRCISEAPVGPEPPLGSAICPPSPHNSDISLSVVLSSLLFIFLRERQSSAAGRPARGAIYFLSNCANCVVFAAYMITPLSRTIWLIVAVEGSWEKHSRCQLVRSH